MLEEFQGGSIVIGRSIGYTERNGARVRKPEREIARERGMTGWCSSSSTYFPI